MASNLPTVEAIQEIESRQDEVLRKLTELEQRILKTLAEFGDQRSAASQPPAAAPPSPETPAALPRAA